MQDQMLDKADKMDQLLKQAAKVLATIQIMQRWFLLR